MRVEITEEKLSTKDRTTGRHYQQVAGDIITVPDDFGKSLCEKGWARDVDGVVQTGERIVRGAIVKPNKAEHAPTKRGV